MEKTSFMDYTLKVLNKKNMVFVIKALTRNLINVQKRPFPKEYQVL